MISIAVSGPVNDPAVYANPIVQPVINALLGQDVILGSVVAVTSLPEAMDQEFHIGMPLLFGEDDLGVQVPPYCLTFVVPLVDMNAKTAPWRSIRARTNRYWKTPRHWIRSFRKYRLVMRSCSMLGSGTTAQQTNPLPRDRFSITPNQRPWFRDVVNFGQQNVLVIEDQELLRVDAAHRHLFDWTRRPGRA